MGKISEMNDRVADIIGVQRCIAIEAVEEMMSDSFERLGVMMVTTEKESSELLEFDSSVCGLPKELLQEIYTWSLAGNFQHWMSTRSEPEMVSMTLAFLGKDSLLRNDFRSRFPNAFKKWQKDEDDALLESYHTGESLGSLSDRFGRNVNAIKLRLEKLGVDLGPQAGRRRFTQK